MIKQNLSYIKSNRSILLIIVVLCQISFQSNLNKILVVADQSKSPKFFILGEKNNFLPDQINLIESEWTFSYSEERKSEENDFECSLDLIHNPITEKKLIIKGEANQNNLQMETEDKMVSFTSKRPLSVRIFQSENEQICLKAKEFKVTNLQEALESLKSLSEEFGNEVKILNTEVELWLTPFLFPNLEINDLLEFEEELDIEYYLFGNRFTKVLDKERKEKDLLILRLKFHNQAGEIFKEILSKMTSFCQKWKPFEKPSGGCLKYYF